MVSLSDSAKAAQQALRDAATDYQAIVEQVIANPTGEFIEKLRRAEEHVSERATRWALEYVTGAEPDPT